MLLAKLKLKSKGANIYVTDVVGLLYCPMFVCVCVRACVRACAHVHAGTCEVVALLSYLLLII